MSSLAVVIRDRHLPASPWRAVCRRSPPTSAPRRPRRRRIHRRAEGPSASRAIANRRRVERAGAFGRESDGRFAQRPNVAIASSYALRGFVAKADDAALAASARRPARRVRRRERRDQHQRHPEPTRPGASIASISARAAEPDLHLQRTAVGVHRVHHRHRHPAHAHEFTGRIGAGFDAVTGGRASTTATATARTSPAPWAAPPTASRRTSPHPVRVLDCPARAPRSA
jgi:hypothetical protein